MKRGSRAAARPRSALYSTDKRCGHYRDSLTPPDPPHAFVCFALDRNVFCADAERGRDPLAHGRGVRPDLGCFANYGHIDIHDLVPPPFRQLIGFAEQLDRIRAFPGHVRGRKMRSNVTERSRTQHGIGHGVRDRIRIRVTSQSMCVGNFDAAEDELAPFGETVGVVAYTYTHVVNDRILPRRREGREERMSQRRHGDTEISTKISERTFAAFSTISPWL